MDAEAITEFQDSFDALMARKYGDKVCPEHRAAMQAIGLARVLLKQHEKAYDDLIKAEQYMHNVGGLLDPTLYRDMLYSKNFKLSTKLMEAAQTFLRAVDAVERELKAP